MEAILYIPAAGDPYRVMASGVCGAHPPRVHLWGRPPTWRSGAGRGEKSLSTHALPLVWEGEVVPEAVDRLARRLAAAGLASASHAAWTDHPGQLAWAAFGYLGGSVVVL